MPGTLETIISGDYVIVSVKCPMVGTSKKASDRAKSQLASAVGADPKRIKAQAVILDAPEITRAVSVQNTFRSWVRGNSAPAEDFLRDGCFFLHKSLLGELETKHAESCIELAGIVDALTEPARYAELEEAARRELGEEFRPGIMPSAEKIRSDIGISYSAFVVAVPPELDPAAYQRELAKQGAALKSAHAEVEETLKAELIGLLENLKTRCAEYGRKKRLHESIITNLRQFCARFPLRNVSNNADLAYVVSEVGVWAEGLSVEVLRENQDGPSAARTAVVNQATEYLGAIG